MLQKSFINYIADWWISNVCSVDVDIWELIDQSTAYAVKDKTRVIEPDAQMCFINYVNGTWTF